MSTYHGKSAKLDFGGEIAGMTGWDMTTSCDEAEDTAAGDSWKSFLAGKLDVTMSFSGNAKTERTLKVGTEASIKCYIDDTNYFIINAICVGESETANINDVGKLTYDFVGEHSTPVAYG